MKHVNQNCTNCVEVGLTNGVINIHSYVMIQRIFDTYMTIL